MNNQQTYIRCENKYEMEQAQKFYNFKDEYGIPPIIYANIGLSFETNRDVISFFEGEFEMKKFVNQQPDFKDITKQVLGGGTPFIKSKEDYRKIFIGDKIFSESHRWSVRVTQISEVNGEIVLSGDVLEGGNRIFGITLKEYEVLQENYRFSSLGEKGSE